MFVRAASPEPVASDRVAPSWYVGQWPQRRSSRNAYTLGTFSSVVETTAAYAEMASTMAISVAVGFIANPDHVEYDTRKMKRRIKRATLHENSIVATVDTFGLPKCASASS